MVVAGKHFSHLPLCVYLQQEKMGARTSCDRYFFFYESAAEVKQTGGGRFFLDFF